MKPQHFHLAAAICLAIAAVVVALMGMTQAAIFLGIGACVAALYWKASRSGLSDNSK